MVSKVPDDIQIISFNDTTLAKQVYPPLSSVTVYTEEMGRTAMDILNKQLLAPRKIPTLTKLGTKLTLRNSTKWVNPYLHYFLRFYEIKCTIFR